MFYQVTIVATLAVGVTAFATAGDVARIVDVAVLGMGVFLAVGRLGCFHVACCHGRPARWGVAYGDRHVAAGFWHRWRGRTLLPVRLFEAAASALLVVLALVVSAVPGTAAVVYATGYAVSRFALERLRGDPVRPHAFGLSEGQWCCLATAGACLVLHPSIWTLIPAIGLALAACVLVASRRARELVEPPHLYELDEITTAVLADRPGPRETRCGVAVSLHTLPDQRRDWILSSTHPRWSPSAAREIADQLWPGADVVGGRTPGLVHILEGRAAATGSRR